MSKQSLPVFSIRSIREDDHSHEELIASGVKDYLSKRPYLFHPHRHSFYLIVYLTEAGGGTHTLDFVKYTGKTGQIFFMVPGQPHSWKITAATDGYVINFSENLFTNFLKDAYYLEQFPFFSGHAEDQVIQLSKENQAIATGLCEKIIAEEKQDRDAGAMDLIRTLLIQLFITVSRQKHFRLGKHSPKPGNMMLHNFRKLVEANYRHLKLPAEYAARLYVTPNYLNALCKDLLGKTAGEVIRERIVLEIKRLLVNTEMNIAGIADLLSFEDHSYFTKFFKKHTGSTPEEFRKKQQAIYLGQ